MHKPVKDQTHHSFVFNREVNPQVLYWFKRGQLVGKFEMVKTGEKTAAWSRAPEVVV